MPNSADRVRFWHENVHCKASWAVIDWDIFLPKSLSGTLTVSTHHILEWAWFWKIRRKAATIIVLKSCQLVCISVSTWREAWPWFPAWLPWLSSCTSATLPSPPSRGIYSVQRGLFPAWSGWRRSHRCRIRAPPLPWCYRPRRRWSRGSRSTTGGHQRR